ncbi:ABC transporter substrate-binding protein [Paenibacillus mendelii]|uniref:ABC transporter substrate-binding protein n=1 Tax=Paenibacillus mendelii TaxID=206163 RepID=A0ABV6J866_9BACL|nr:ABC transporter substrate-binding protein [Paenibacillus mendelii]MCQ6561268.1 AraC family transcriptional regulator [Paenibacillus mendelii]
MNTQHVYTLENIKLTEYPPSASRVKRTFEVCTLLIVVHGAGEIWIDNKSYYPNKSGSVLFCNPGTVVYFTEENGHNQGLLLYQLTIGAYHRLELEDRVVYEPMQRSLYENGEVASQCYHQLKEIAESMELMSHEQSASSSFKLQMRFNEMMSLIAEEYEASRQELSRTAIERAILYMENHYDEDIHRDQLARMAGLNSEYFSRLFKKETGRNFSKRLTEIRINRAQEFLLTSRASLREIAERVGYKNEFYLSRKFKETTGISPSLYLHKPKRIASVSSHFTACLLALGVTPVLAKINPFIKELFKGSLQEGSTYTLDLHTFHFNQMVAETSPDLILCYDTYRELGELKRMAPTISLSLTKLSWREQFRFIAEIVNAEEAAKELLDGLDEKVEQARKLLVDKVARHETVLIIEIWKDKIMVIGDSGGRGGQLIYKMLKLSPPQLVRSELCAGEWYKIIPLEELPLYAADYIFVTIYEEKGGEPYAAKIMSSEIWNNLPAVRKNRVYVNDHGTFYNWDPVSMHMQLELLMHHFMS